MEHMIAAELLSGFNVAKADAALEGWGALLVGGLYVLQLPQLMNELTPFNQGNAFMAQSRKIIRDLTQNVNRKGAATYDNVKKSAVDQKVTRVKEEGDDVKDKFLLEPLFIVGKLKQRNLILKIRFDCPEEEATNFEADHHVDVVDTFGIFHVLLNKDVGEESIKADNNPVQA